MSQAGSFNTGLPPPTPNPGPNKLVTLVDDFLAPGSNSGNSPGQLLWNTSSLNATILGTATNPGLARVGFPSGGGGTGFFLDNTVVNSFVIGGGTLEVNWVIALTTLSDVTNPYMFWSGLSDTVVNAQPNSGIFFTYIDSVNSGKWVINCMNLGVTTSVNTSVTAVTGFVNLGLVVAADGASVIFKINGAVVGTISTNMPTGIGLCPFVQWVDQPGYVLPNLPASLVDLFYLTYTLTIAR